LSLEVNFVAKTKIRKGDKELGGINEEQMVLYENRRGKGLSL